MVFKIPNLKFGSTKPTGNTISPWVKKIFFFGLVLFVITVFVTSWTSTSPNFFYPEEVNLLVDNISNFPDIFKDSGNTSSQWDLLAERLLPELLQPPMQLWDLLCPTIFVIYICLILRFIPSNNWTRLPIKFLTLVLMGRYFVWRTVGTLNLSHWASATFSLVVYTIEAIGFLNFFLYSLQSIWSTAHKRSAEADHYSQNIVTGKYLPSVDVFVPTYNEPDFVVRRTVVGCQLMEYANKKIYILDDQRRPHIRALAEELDCEYITRPDNQHAKAGNLNNALPQTQGELIAIFDADFVPFKNFLTRTVGFFQQPQLALIQTPQTFYNPDHHARNLGVDHLLYDDLANFFMFSQSNRDVANCAICCGTSYVVRRKALESVGGYSTLCLAEDSPTSIIMLTKGWRITYLREILSMGESTRTYIDFVKQRTRWHQGNYQIFCCGKQIPIWSTMNWVRKSFFLTFYLGSFQPIFRSVIILTPLINIYTGIAPILLTTQELIYYFIPFFVLQIGSIGWMTEYTTSFLFNEVYETILCFPLLKCLVFAIRDPFGLPSTVTRKGVKNDKKNYNLNYTWPLLVVVALIVIILCVHLGGYRLGLWQTPPNPEYGLIFFWLFYNMIIVSIAAITAIDQPERRAMDRFPLHTTCQIKLNNSSEDYHSLAHVYQGYTINLCEGGAQIVLASNDFVLDTDSIYLEFPENSFSVMAQVCRSSRQIGSTQVALKFSQLSTEQHRQLIEMLYSNMTWWKRSKRPGNLDVFLSMLSSFLRLKPLRSKVVS